VYGAEVGANTTSVRRSKLNRSTPNTTKEFTRLGLQASGGRNNYALNWYQSDTYPINPLPVGVPSSITNVYATVIMYTQVLVSWGTPSSLYPILLYTITASNGYEMTSTTTNVKFTNG
jgi:hypothetical protein